MKIQRLTKTHINKVQEKEKWRLQLHIRPNSFKRFIFAIKTSALNSVSICWIIHLNQQKFITFFSNYNFITE